MKISTFGFSDKGKLRRHNEDMFLLDDTRRIYAVADGLGGLPEGSLASNLAITYLDKATSSPESEDFNYKDLFDFINNKVYEEGKRVNKKIGIGTTLTVLKLNGQNISIGHVGDCAVFLFREGTWQQITHDHTLATEIYNHLKPGKKEVLLPEYFKHTLTRCIGQQSSVKPDVYYHTLQKSDRLLICSDGITHTQSEDELLEEVSAANTPKGLIRRIIDIANERGGPDNATGIAIFLE